MHYGELSIAKFFCGFSKLSSGASLPKYMFVQVVGDARRENVIVDERSKSFIGIKIVPFYLLNYT